MARHSYRRTVDAIDPTFFIPEEAVGDLVYDTTKYIDDGEDSLDEQDDSLVVDDIFIVGDDDEEGDDQQETLDTPDIYSIISQTPMTAPNGQLVLEVVIDVEDIYGADTYEVRNATF